MAMNQSVDQDEDEGLDDPQVPAAGPSGSASVTSLVAVPSGAASAVQGAGVGQYALSEGVEGDKQLSDRSSSTPSGPGTPRGLQTLLEKIYDPAKEPYARYEKRVLRIVSALRMLEVHIDEVIIQSMLWDADITAS